MQQYQSRIKENLSITWIINKLRYFKISFIPHFHWCVSLSFFFFYIRSFGLTKFDSVLCVHWLITSDRMTTPNVQFIVYLFLSLYIQHIEHNIIKCYNSITNNSAQVWNKTCCFNNLNEFTEVIDNRYFFTWKQIIKL
jgi:hypothetical protein